MYLKIYNIEVPNSILVLERHPVYSIFAYEHFVISKVGDYYVLAENGMSPKYDCQYHETDIYDMFFYGIKYKECSLKAFNKLKAFL
jgi:hypothetical protein